MNSLSRLIRAAGLPLLVIALTVPVLSLSHEALAQDKPIRIGLLYDLSGPFAAAGSVASQIGAQIAIDLTNERGGVLGKYKVEPVTADSQSKPDVA
ncbi:MAG: ABC transporter substrate-binding protein, partial [Hyphomicrobiales bacterium]|nr:ABC transporter substrate-binding protein [Hyphomicrobiales bacterium]